MKGISSQIAGIINMLQIIQAKIGTEEGEMSQPESQEYIAALHFCTLCLLEYDTDFKTEAAPGAYEQHRHN